MDADDLPELTALLPLLDQADLTAECRQTALWCLKQLPRLYQRLRETNEEQYHDAIRRLAQAMLKELPAGLAQDVVARLDAMHERLGLRGLGLKVGCPRRAA
jgi:hypothetical protein